MKKTIFIGLFLLNFAQIFAQNKSDSIEIKKALETTFKQNGKNLTPRKLLNITQTNTEAYKEMKIAKNNYNIESVFGSVGGFMVGWVLGGAVVGGEPNWTLAGIGAGLIIVSIPFSTAYSKHAINAVRIYNNGLKLTGMNNMDFKVGLTCNGIGIKMTF